MAKIKSGFKGERILVLPSAIIRDFKEIELGKLLYITDIGFYPKAGFHFRERTAGESNQYILMYCVDGSGWVELENNRQTLYSGEVIILPRGQAHSYGSSPKDPWTIYWIHFDGNMAEYFSTGMSKPVQVKVEKNSRIGERIELFDDIFTILKNGYSRPNLEYSVTVLFHFLGTLKFTNAFRSSAFRVESDNNPVDLAIHFMHENLQRKIKLEEISDYIGISASHFSLIFQKKTGHSPLSYFNQLKIKSACHYLDSSNLHINQIARMVGYDDPLYFSRIFSKVMGYSPSDYKERIKG